MSLIDLYHRLPYPARTAAATARGAYLTGWRYGRSTSDRMAAAKEREQWPQEKWDAWKRRAVSDLLQRARHEVPYYYKKWEQLAALNTGGTSGPTAKPQETLGSWPTLEKEAVRQDPQSFVADDKSTLRMFRERTSGSSGTPLQLWWSLETVREYYALYEARIRGWHGVSRRDRWGILGGQLVSPPSQRRPPFWVWNAAMRQLYLSAYHISEENTRAYIEAIRKYRLVYILAYPSALYSIARFAREKNLEAPRLRVVISNAEPLYDFQRRTISEVFQCPVRDTYGMAELVAMGAECEHGAMHLFPEVGIVEVVDGQMRPMAPGTSGEFICSGLLNKDMPLIRYRVGDHGALAAPSKECPCGRTLPLLESVEGRQDDLIRTSDGREIGRLDPVFKHNLPVKVTQIVQEDLHHIRVKVVPDARFGAVHADKLSRALRKRLGAVRIEVETVDEIPRMANGKFKSVVSKVDRNAK